MVHLHVHVGGHGVTGHIQHLGQGQLSHSVGVQAGSVEHLNALGLGAIHVDVVQAHAAHADHLQVLGGIQHLFGDGGVNTHDQHIVIADHVLQLLAGQRSVGSLALHLSSVQVVHLHVLAQFLGDGLMDSVDNQTFHG